MVLFIAIEPLCSDLQIPHRLLQEYLMFLGLWGRILLLLCRTDNIALIFLLVALLPVILWQAVTSCIVSEVEGKCCRDVWHGTGGVTFVVNQPPAHPQLPISGCDNRASQPHGYNAVYGQCFREVPCKVSLEADHRKAATVNVAHKSHCNVLTSCTGWAAALHRHTQQKRRTMAKFPHPVCVCGCTKKNSSGFPFCCARGSDARFIVSGFKTAASVRCYWGSDRSTFSTPLGWP